MKLSDKEIAYYKEKEHNARENLKKIDGWMRHWHLANLSNAIYEQRRYKASLKPIEQAFMLAPNCPYVLWNYAGTLRMLGRTEEAREIYRRLLQRGAKRISKGKCGEGIKWCRSLVNDCRYMMALVSKSPREAARWLRLHLKLRGKNTPSIFAYKEVKKELDNLIQEYYK